MPDVLEKVEMWSCGGKAGEPRGCWLAALACEIGSKDVELVGEVACASSSYLRRRDRFLAGRGSVIDTAGVIVTFH